MTNKELYDIVKTEDVDKLASVLPNHYLARGEKFVLPEGKMEHSNIFNDINNITELSDWSTINYKLSGKYSDYLSVIFLPDVPNIRLEIRNKQIVSALWVVSLGLYVDITHNIYFLNNMPLGRMVAADGYIHGAILSKLPELELYKLLTSPIPDERILECDFIVTYASFTQSVADTIDDLFETFRNVGFKTATMLNTTIPKWTRTIESAKLMIGGGNLPYKCNKILTSYSSMEMIQLLSMKTLNQWGVTTNIGANNLLAVLNISWDTMIDGGKVRIIPVVAFNFGGEFDTKDQYVTIDKSNYTLYKTFPNFTTKDIGNYCVGDMFTGTNVNDVLVLDKKYGSNKTPFITSSCPKCKHSVDISNGNIYCINPRCPTVVLNSIQVWIDKFCPTVDKYVMADFLHRHDIINLNDIYTVIDSIEIVDNEYKLIFEGVQKSREMPGEFLNIIIPFLNIKECNEIMKNFNSMYINLITKHIFTDTTLSRIGFDSITISKLLGFMETNKIQFVRTMFKYFKQSLDHPLYNKTFFIDGLLYDRDRIKYENIINKYGGRVVSQFAPYITGFIYGKFGNSAIVNTVRQLSTHKDVAIYSEEEFNKLVEQANGGSN